MIRVSALWPNDKIQSECSFHGLNDPWIESLTYDSRSCGPRSIYFAYVGTHTDGHRYIGDAITNGAIAVVHSLPLIEYREDILYIQTVHPRRLYSAFSSAMHDYPQHKLPIVGVTGTDGKTSTCEFLHQILTKHGLRCGLLDTVNMDDGMGKRPSPYRQSTPEATEIHAFLVRCLANGVQLVVLEATSHGLSNEFARLADIPFSIAIFTTLTSEHLEFHQNLENYIQAKLNLARQLTPKGTLILPASFPYRKEAVEAAPRGVEMLTYALDESGSDADLQVKTFQTSLERRYFTTLHAGQMVRSSIPFAPVFFLRNALGSILAASKLLERNAASLLSDLTWLEPIPGRFEVYHLAHEAVAIIDFAHTADAFSRLFAEVRSLRPQGRLIAVFGAAGDRDKSKRAPMGAIAASWCDTMVLTDEDPRGEQPQAIFHDIRAGIPLESHAEVQEIADRTQAIAFALRICKAGDTLLLLGKGHERSIQYAAKTVAWNERLALEVGMKTRKVGLLYGGKSVEQAISIRSATNLYQQMIKAGHQVLAIGIAGDGQWYLQETSGLQASDQLPLCVRADCRLQLLPGVGICTSQGGEKLDLDLCFPITHGSYGEDGRLQGLLEILELPYVGCGPLTSAIGMHKDFAKQLAKCCGIPVVPSTSLSNRDYDYLNGTSSIASPMLLRTLSNESDMQNRAPLRSRTALSRLMNHLQDTLGSSILIKPNTGGSSVGVVALKQYNDSILLEALKEVGRYSDTVLIELLVTDMVEVECAVLQKDGLLEVTKPGMVVDPLGKDFSFLTYGSKYSDTRSAHMDIPAPIPLECSKTIRQFTKNLCEALDVHGLARVDFFFRPDTRAIFFNEINTLPGMTAQSHYPRLVEATGYAWPELLDILFTAAFDEHQKRTQLVYEFDKRI